MRRSPHNPILTRADLPGDVTSVFNPGAIRHGGKIRLMLRVQTRGRETFLQMAESDDGIRFALRGEPLAFDIEGAYHVYDPRLSWVDDAGYAMFAVDTDEGCRLGVARTRDFASFELLGVGPPDVRNGVLFPERVDGRYLRLDRPNTKSGSGDEIFLAESRDLVAWRTVGPVMKGRFRYWDELIGPGPPPIRTPEGWLLVYHGIAQHFTPIYQAGVALLDLKDPTRVIGRGRNNILEPRELYELTGQVPNVVFPTGMIEEDDGRILLYYGAADTVIGLATATVEELIKACHD